MALQRRIATVYKHEQDVPSTTWTIQHYLHGYPIVDVYVTHNAELQKIIPKSVTYLDDISCLITFSIPYAGYATVA